MLAACGRQAPLPEARVASSAAPRPAAPADSLALRTPAGVEIWFTLARSGHDSAGSSCVERGLEIRDGPRRTPIPLLYTGEAPRFLNDSTVSARLWTNCVPGPTYRVDLRTGQPVRADR